MTQIQKFSATNIESIGGLPPTQFDLIDSPALCTVGGRNRNYSRRLVLMKCLLLKNALISVPRKWSRAN